MIFYSGFSVKIRKSKTRPAQAFMLFLLMSGCGNQIIPQAPAPDCGGAVQIGIYDDMTEILCGCDEAAGTQAKSRDILTCTFDQGPPLHFFYLGDSLSHQVQINNGATPFYSGPLFDPDEKNAIRAGAVEFTSTGTYTLTSRQLTVSLVVQ